MEMARNPGPVGDHPLSRMIRSARTAADMTLMQVAEKAGISDSYLSRIERGLRVNLTEDIAVALAQALKLDPVEVKRLGGIIEGPQRTRAAGISDSRQAIMADPNLTSEQRNLMLAMYSTWVRPKLSEMGDEHDAA